MTPGIASMRSSAVGSTLSTVGVRTTTALAHKSDSPVRRGRAFALGSGAAQAAGGPIAIAEIVLVIADDMQQRGVTHGSGTAEEQAADGAAAALVGRAVAVAVVPKKKSGKAAVASRNATTLAAKVAVMAMGSYEGAVPTALAGLVLIPTALELAADPADIKVVRDLYGSRA